ncbi:MAG TPA: transporter substrate-binding domain-containing protein [Vicinamibacterales bacterium]|nr:transporter substrate-binding domain-containing protein [Vicinamibacterales bacterium]
MPSPLPTDIAPFLQPWTGDFEAMKARRVIRVLTVRNPVLYYVDGAQEVGITYEAAKAFEEVVNKGVRDMAKRVHVLFLPVRRDELIPRLLAGEGDIVAAQLTITPDRLEQVDFSEPFGSDVSEIIVTGPSAKSVRSVDDLAGLELYVRESSSYAEHLRGINAQLAAKGLPPVIVTPADEALETGDILEMVSAGLVPATVSDDFIAKLWAEVLPDLVLHPDIAVNTGGRIGWAFRKDSPELSAAVNAFVKTSRQGTLAGNVLINKYLKNSKWVRNARSGDDLDRFRETISLFRKYADQYDFDYLLMAAQGYQESGLDQSKRSPVGAIGIMQVMPATARDKAVGIPDIENLESNIHAGIKYNRWLADSFFNEPGVDANNRALFAFASYNAGPNRISRLRREAAEQGLDPNRWFNNVETVVARRVGREPVQYVSNIYKYYLAYRMLIAADTAR